MFVNDLDAAYEAYWNSHSRREEQAAYHEMLLFGARDGYGPDGAKFRQWLVRMLRLIAAGIEKTYS